MASVEGILSETPCNGTREVPPEYKVLDIVAGAGLTCVEVATGNWSDAPHADLATLAGSSGAREEFLGGIGEPDGPRGFPPSSGDGPSEMTWVRRGEHRLCLASVDSPAELRASVPVGTLLPLTAGGSAARVLTEPVARWHIRQWHR